MRIIFLFMIAFSFLQAEISMEEFDLACSKMKWLREGSHELPQSLSEIVVPDNHILLIGNDAIHYRNLIDCIAIDESIEAVVFSKHEPYDSVILKSYHNEGYIASDDWQEMNEKSLMTAIIENTEEANRQRLWQGIEEKVKVLGWLKAPTRDAQTNTVYWAIEAAQGTERIANSVALKLGRYGYEQFTWVTPKAYYKANGGELELILNSHRFLPGDRYEDYERDDKVASYGLAGLVASVTGAKVIQTISIGSALLQLKKFAALILAVCAGACYGVIRFLRRKKDSKLLMRES